MQGGTSRWFYYPINLHYSQTYGTFFGTPLVVLLPYKFTLLSNMYDGYVGTTPVLLPYKFTLLSNQNYFESKGKLVLLPYKFTLLSNYPSI